MIVVTGPESTGKTTLTGFLAEKLPAFAVWEFAREYLNSIDGPYVHDDLRHIGQMQAQAIKQSLEHGHPYVVSDTWKYELMVWERYRFEGPVWDFDALFGGTEPDVLVLCKPDLAWKDDPLRENPDDREVLFESYRKLAEESKIPIVLASGDGHHRMSNVLEEIRALIGKTIP